MFWENFSECCKKMNTTPSAVANDLGIALGNVTAWKNGRIPRWQTLEKLAEYFNVTSEELIVEKEKTSGIEPNATFLSDNNVHLIPLFESVSAGFGAYADSSILEYVPCYITNAAEAKETICIKVNGNSMAPKIENGDVIQVHKQTSVDSGQIAVVLLEGEDGLVKKVLYGDDWIELHSLNKFYPPMRFEGEDILKLQVVGLVKKIIKEV